MTETIYIVDRGHGGVRLIVLLVLIATFAAVALILNPLLKLLEMDDLLRLVIIVAAGFTLSYVVTTTIEKWLRRVWPSGRTLAVSERALTLRERNGASSTLAWNEPVSVTSWSFVITTRRTAIPRGWYCVALRLVQGDKSIKPYTFLKPKDAEDMPAWHAFEQLVPRKKGFRQDSDHMERLIESQLNLRLAERERWEDGAEMDSADFIELVKAVAGNVSSWPPGDLR
jgi:hypothetical protein